ncbi:MAG: hypothetical protein ACYSWU_19110 [Planctomycetota bacterium]|jgi:hypothetical protein
MDAPGKLAVDIEEHNHRQIEMLNQRGGRTLSIVDLLLAGTISVEMAAYAMRAMERGASLLTGARPGGAGKTTLMAAILNMLPPEVPIVTVDRPEVIADGLRRTADQPLCYLAHEFGSGQYYGYIWGPEVADFLSLIRCPCRVASCLHADTLDELTEIARSPPLAVGREMLGQVDLILFMRVDVEAGSYRRRVATFYEADGSGGHRHLFEWDAGSNAFRRVGELRDPDALPPYVAFVQQLVEQGAFDSRKVRRRVVEFYGHGV